MYCEDVVRLLKEGQAYFVVKNGSNLSCAPVTAYEIRQDYFDTPINPTYYIQAALKGNIKVVQTWNDSPITDEDFEMLFKE